MLDKKYFDNVIAEIQSIIDDHGFKLSDDIYSNEKLKFQIKFNEAKKMYCLEVARLNSEQQFDDFIEINAWLFDESQNAKDATAVGIDFAASLRKELGIKSATRTSNANISLPTASKSGSMNVTGFTKKMLDIYPAVKEDYKAHIAQNGNFLYLNFFGNSIVPCIKNTFESGTKKQIKKLYDVFENAYVDGDGDTVNLLIASLCAASFNNEEVSAQIRETLSVNNHFLSSYNSFKLVFDKNKKLINALVK